MRPLTPPLLLLALTASLTVAGCRYGSVPPSSPGFATRELRVASSSDTAVFQVEVAVTPEQQAVGLMDRRELPPSAGMLFLFEEEQPAGTEFWMHRTHVPLSVALLDADGVIRQLLEMEPCTSRLSLRCPKYRAGVPFHAALELNRGSLESRGMGVGDRALLDRSR